MRSAVARADRGDADEPRDLAQVVQHRLQHGRAFAQTRLVSAPAISWNAHRGGDARRPGAANLGRQPLHAVGHGVRIAEGIETEAEDEVTEARLVALVRVTTPLGARQRAAKKLDEEREPGALVPAVRLIAAAQGQQGVALACLEPGDRSRDPVVCLRVMGSRA